MNPADFGVVEASRHLARRELSSRELVEACLERARRDGARRVAISTRPTMTSAHRVYRALGFAPDPALDWEPLPGVLLLGYALGLEPAADGSPASG